MTIRNRLIPEEVLFRAIRGLKTPFSLLPVASTFMIPTKNIVDLKPLDESFKQWLTGFWEGDGHAGVRLIGKSPQLVVSFAQKSPSVLDLVESKLGLEDGNLHIHIGSKCSILTYCGYPALLLVNLFSKYAVCPLRISQLNSILTKYRLKLAKGSFPTEDWFVGFWDAEGSSSCYPGWIVISVAQKDKVPLEGIKLLFGFREVYSSQHTWRITTSHQNNLKFKEMAKALV